MSVAGYGISTAYSYLHSNQSTSAITQNAGYINPDGTGSRLGQEMAGAATNSRSGGCIKASVDYGGSNTQIATYYPSSDGAVYGTKQNIILNKGTIIDRYGSNGGNYFAPVDTPIYQRALPYDIDLTKYHKCEVVKPFIVESSTIAPAFGQIGGGTQYHSFSKASTLVESGYIREIIGN